MALSVSAHAQAPASKTFNKSFNTDNKSTIRLDLPGEVDLKIWNNPSIRIEIVVSLPAGANAAMLNELANVGRYNLMAKPSDDALLIHAPNMQKQVRIKGEELKETLSFVVFVPKDLKVQVAGAEQLATSKK
ncbi:MAG TPA: hypothetical protein PK971_15945 [Saprospiraceae bacterium]|nr:hypothetical protein [Saprospiraceae bacterium]